MLHRIRNFLNREDGAVTVDWVVLTAAIASFGTIVITYLGQPVKDMDAAVGGALNGVEVGTITVKYDESDS